jgi:hypothetical protein
MVIRRRYTEVYLGELEVCLEHRERAATVRHRKLLPATSSMQGYKMEALSVRPLLK